MIIVCEPDGKFVKSIAPECLGFHAVQLCEEDGKTVICGTQNNGYSNRVRKEKALSPTFRVSTPFNLPHSKAGLD